MAIARHSACRALQNPLAIAGGGCGTTESAPLLAKTVCFQLTIPIATARDGGSVQQRLSAAAKARPLTNAAGVSDKRYSLGHQGCRQHLW